MTSATALKLKEACQSRLLFIDGAMGTMIQRHQLAEADYRGERFAAHGHDLRGNNDLLVLTRPDIIQSIHEQYLDAGADIIETNTFNGTAIAQSDYGLEAIVHELNVAAARVARAAADIWNARTPQRPRYVAGAIGPTNRTLSISPDVNDPAFRAVSFEAVVDAYETQVDGLLDGGVDVLLVETIFDTLNAKAAAVAVRNVFDRRGVDIPVMLSVTITDRSGRTLSGQTVEAFWISMAHVRPFSVGLNCALGAEDMRPYLRDLSTIADCFVSCYPNAGLPNAFGGYDETPEQMAGVLAGFAREGLLNLIGGCCGTTPDHIRAMVTACEGVTPRGVPTDIARYSRFSGLEPLEIRPESNFQMVGERTNVTGSAKFARLIKAGDFTAAVDVATEQVRNGANILDVNMDEGMLDSEASMKTFLNLLATEPEVARVPFMIDSSKWSVLETGLKCVQGKAIVNSISLKEGEADFLTKARTVRAYGAAVIVMAFDEAGQADTIDRKVQICGRAYRLLTEQIGLPARGHHLRPQRAGHRDGARRAQRLRDQLHRGDASDPRDVPWRTGERGHQQSVLQLPRQRRGARGDPLGVPVPRHQGRPDDGYRQRGATRGVRGHPAGAPRRWSRTCCSTGGRTRPSGSSHAPSRCAAAGRSVRSTCAGARRRSASGWRTR